MKTGYTILTSILIAIFILLSGLIVYIIIQEVNSQDSGSIPNPLMTADFETQDINNENGQTSGQRGYVEITKDQLDAIFSEQLKEFADEYVKNGEFTWVSIITADGLGIYFPSPNLNYAEYGILTEDGQISSLQATITLENKKYVFHHINGTDSAPVPETIADTVDTSEITSEDQVDTIDLDKTNVVPVENTADYERNDYSDADYENYWLDITFTAPETYFMTTSQELAEWNAFTSDFFDSSLTATEMSCKSLSGTPNVNVVSEKPTASMTEQEYIQESLLSLGIPDNYLEYTTLAGKEAVKTHIDSTSSRYQGLGINQDFYFLSKENTFYVITLTYRDDETTAAAILLNGFQAK